MTAVPLSPVTRRFVLHWGEMGTRWGINRTVAQIHALLYVSPDPLNAEQLAATLSVARSNVSTSVRELQGWGIIRVVHVLGDRRDHFESMKDVWEMFRIVLDERKRRETDPTLEMLRECMAEMEKTGGESPHVRERLAAMNEFFETMTSMYEQMRAIPTSRLVKLAKMGRKLRKAIEMVV